MALVHMASRLMAVASELKDAARSGEASDPDAATLIAARLERAALDISARDPHALDCRV